MSPSLSPFPCSQPFPGGGWPALRRCGAAGPYQNAPDPHHGPRCGAGLCGVRSLRKNQRVGMDRFSSTAEAAEQARCGADSLDALRSFAPPSLQILTQATTTAAHLCTVRSPRVSFAAIPTACPISCAHYPFLGTLPAETPLAVAEYRAFCSLPLHLAPQWRRPRAPPSRSSF